MAVGRPSSYTAEIGETIFEQMVEGRSLRAICRDEEMPDFSTVKRWLRKDDAFRAQYARAREDQADTYLDEIIEIADDDGQDRIERQREHKGTGTWVENSEYINRSRTRIDARKWFMSKMAPKKYGDKVEVEHGGKDGQPIAFTWLPIDDRAAESSDDER